ncbi:Hypothetical protein SRAE_2000302400 [Strongyloides ratti]|uniref:Uncharacterized protein n=1 Tax=Strongyloides ratti TaxID=34506 RepID=A0A090LF23_STRRB|nr:Hypothetical protein SRAE_2000302400 [Strongyloides ratti]CEF68367.1 Hypothetical protein SRAE_2000302400 [Strongyloides ratti]
MKVIQILIRNLIKIKKKIIINKDVCCTSSVLGLNNKSALSTKTTSTAKSQVGLSNNNFKQYKTSNNTKLNIVESGKTTKVAEGINLEGQAANNYINSYRAIKRPSDNVKEDITQGNDSVHLFASSRKQDISESQNINRLLETAIGLEKVTLLDESSSSGSKNKSEKKSCSDGEGDEVYEVVQDATILNEDDTLYGIEKVMPEFHL